MMRRRAVLCKDARVLEDLVARLEARARQPLRLAWVESPSLAVPTTQNWVALGVDVSSASGVEVKRGLMPQTLP
jgi:hypothetical protein